MRAIVQRVHQASVSVENTIVGEIGKGLCVFVGICHSDTQVDAEWLAKKVALLRIFPDDHDKMSHNVIDVGGNVLVISQFTVYGNCRSGCRPDFMEAAPPDTAIPLYENFLFFLEQQTGKPPQCGQFQKKMSVHVVNDGPVTLLIDSPRKG
jgi:D-tyrosyl-tRNA(Tyr) deacylase